MPRKKGGARGQQVTAYFGEYTDWHAKVDVARGLAQGGGSAQKLRHRFSGFQVFAFPFGVLLLGATALSFACSSLVGGMLF